VIQFRHEQFDLFRRFFGFRIMKNIHRLVLAAWLASQLLLGQQLALAHMLGHAGDRIHAEALDVAAHDEDEAHSAADALLHVCSTCVAFLGFDLPLADASAAVQGASVRAVPVDSRVRTASPVRHSAAYLSCPLARRLRRAGFHFTWSNS
jgi:hypothetical protein